MTPGQLRRLYSAAWEFRAGRKDGEKPAKHKGMETRSFILSARLKELQEEIWLLDVCNSWYVTQLHPSDEDRRLFIERITRLREIQREIARLAH